VLSLGQDEFKKRFTPDQIAKVNHPLLRSVLNGISRCGFLKKMATGLISASEFYYPITLIVRKKEADASPDTYNTAESTPTENVKKGCRLATEQV
jgi:hypothetical protein